MSTVPEVDPGAPARPARRGPVGRSPISPPASTAAIRRHAETKDVALSGSIALKRLLRAFLRATSCDRCLSRPTTAARRCRRRSSAASATARRCRRGEIDGLRAGLVDGRGLGRAGRRLRHGGVLARHDRGRDRGADPSHDALGHACSTGAASTRRPGARQAFDRRHRRQRQPDAGAGGRGLRRLRADDLGPRPRPHRRHARQARSDPGLRRRARRSTALQRPSCASVGCAIVGQTADLAPADRRALRHPRRHRDGRIDPADHRLDPVEEARGRARAAW